MAENARPLCAIIYILIIEYFTPTLLALNKSTAMQRLHKKCSELFALSVYTCSACAFYIISINMHLNMMKHGLFFKNDETRLDAVDWGVFNSQRFDDWPASDSKSIKQGCACTHDIIYSYSSPTRDRRAIRFYDPHTAAAAASERAAASELMPISIIYNSGVILFARFLCFRIAKASAAGRGRL